MAAGSHTRHLHLNLNSQKIKHKMPHFRGLTATCDWWLPYWTTQNLEHFPHCRRFLVDSVVYVFKSRKFHWTELVYVFKSRSFYWIVLV